LGSTCRRWRGGNLLGVLLVRSLGSVKVHDSIAVINAIATTIIVISALGLLVKILLVVIIAAKDNIILLVELGGLIL
jgi:hypothetical protein